MQYYITKAGRGIIRRVNETIYDGKLRIGFDNAPKGSKICINGENLYVLSDLNGNGRYELDINDFRGKVTITLNTPKRVYRCEPLIIGETKDGTIYAISLEDYAEEIAEAYAEIERLKSSVTSIYKEVEELKKIVTTGYDLI
jgi:hypothetical protein